MENNINLGSKYFKYTEDGSVECIRVIGIQNQTTVRTIDTNTMERKKMAKEEIIDKYLLLKPDGIVVFSILSIPNDYDVSVALLRSKDATNPNPLPYCVCRQNVADVHANIIRYSEDMNVGGSVSIDTCPGNVPYEMMLTCDGIVKSVPVSCYLNDDLYDILMCIKEKDFDNVIYGIRQRFVDNQTEMFKSRLRDTDHPLGYCSSLKDMLEFNCFMLDFRAAFDIKCIQSPILIVDNVPSRNDIAVLEDDLRYSINNPTIVIYDKDIDMDSIKRDYILLTDPTDVVYLMVFDKGELHQKDYTKGMMNIEEKLEMMKRCK